MASVVASRPAGGATPASETPAPAQRAPPASDAAKQEDFRRACAQLLEQLESDKDAPPALIADTPADTQQPGLGVSWGSSFGQSVAALIDGESA
jgi:hypothetical protein